MLFDTRTRRRRLPARVIAAVLAAALAIGSLLYVGPESTITGLVDLVRGTETAATSPEQQADAFREQVDRDPSDERTWAKLIAAQFAVAARPENLDEQAGKATASGKGAFGEVVSSWERYRELLPEHVDGHTAAFAAQSLAMLERYVEAVEAQRMVLDTDPSADQWHALARLAYLAGDAGLGDRAGVRAIRSAPKSQRRQMKQAIGALKLYAQTGGQGLSIGPDGQAQIPLEALGAANAGSGTGGSR